MIAVKSVRVACIAGTSPNSTALPMATIRLNTSARRSSSNASAIGRSVGISICQRVSCRRNRLRGPGLLPRERSTDFQSPVGGRAWPRPAPIARRSAISRARAGARLVNNPATFAHATSSTPSASVDSIAVSIASGGSCCDSRLEFGSNQEPTVPVRIRVRSLQISGNRRQFALRAGLRYAGLKSSLEREVPGVARFRAMPLADR